MFRRAAGAAAPRLRYCAGRVGRTMPRWCSEPPKETPAAPETELTAHFQLPLKGEGPEKVVYDLAEKVLSLNVLQFRLFQKIVNEAMGKHEMWEYDLVMNLSKALASGGGGGGGFVMAPGAMQAAAPAAAAPAAAEDAAPAEEAAEEKAPEPAAPTSFDLKLTAIAPENKVKTIKALKDAFKLSLKDAKDMVEQLPSAIAKGLSKEEAEKVKKTLSDLGAAVSGI
eukprot:TRINITY_DN6703_c0_g1_i1.p1 TRINITY_DN6703_c0_g1~~TRINITY_DN6703_c0_g1_i1.p1  ORF type:complete len:225 (+),score=69.77 TRINITY_DN6703_c0_g1_i1:89-763(+)